jgi:hypothetical protein
MFGTSIKAWGRGAPPPVAEPRFLRSNCRDWTSAVKEALLCPYGDLQLPSAAAQANAGHERTRFSGD